MTPSVETRLEALSEPVKIHSRILTDTFWLVPDTVAAELGNALDAPCYSCAECRALLQMAPTNEQLRRIHWAKIALDGDLTLARGSSTLEQQRLHLNERYRQLERRLVNAPQDQALAKDLVQIARQLSRLMPS